VSGFVVPDAQELVFVSFRANPAGQPTTGVVVDGRVVPLANVPGLSGDIIEACRVSQDLPGGAKRFVRAAADTLTSFDLAEVRLCAPVTSPEKIICLGLNYRDHATEAGFDAPAVPIFFSKFHNALTGPYDPIMLPRSSGQVDFEGELAAVIGKTAKYVDIEHALEYVAGYTVMNDVTARDLQLRTSQWTAGKTLDTFAPMGPGLVPSAVIEDPQNLKIVTRVNHEEMQSDSTANMVFTVAEIIAFLSSLMTLRPGDIIATGTPAGVGFKREPPSFLRAGDVVEVEIEGIGSIRNPVVAET
jgi:2-keto-4-pentenoate hydratase/2-oxohepta-3-ene-1,7-dioic acid hydratase in catechol pathway